MRLPSLYNFCALKTDGRGVVLSLVDYSSGSDDEKGSFTIYREVL